MLLYKIHQKRYMFRNSLTLLTSTKQTLIIQLFYAQEPKHFKGVRQGTLYNKTTKRNSNIVRYAIDCFAIHMFYNGYNSYLFSCFWQIKVATFRDSKNIDYQVTFYHSNTATLLQRVDAIETAQVNDTKVINSLKQTVTELQTKHFS